MDERDERKRTSEDASKRTWTTSKPESSPCSGISVEDTYLLTMRCPVFRRRDSHLGFRMELETLAGHAKGKGTSGCPARPRVPMGQSGADRPIVVMKRGNAREAKGVGHSRRCWVNGRPEEPSLFAGRRQPCVGGTSRMRRESHVRFCERLGVKFPGPTRRRREASPYPDPGLRAGLQGLTNERPLPAEFRTFSGSPVDGESTWSGRRQGG